MKSWRNAGLHLPTWRRSLEISGCVRAQFSVKAYAMLVRVSERVVISVVRFQFCGRCLEIQASSVLSVLSSEEHCLSSASELLSLSLLLSSTFFFSLLQVRLSETAKASFPADVRTQVTIQATQVNIFCLGNLWSLGVCIPQSVPTSWLGFYFEWLGF